MALSTIPGAHATRDICWSTRANGLQDLLPMARERNSPRSIPAASVREERREKTEDWAVCINRCVRGARPMLLLTSILFGVEQRHVFVDVDSKQLAALPTTVTAAATTATSPVLLRTQFGNFDRVRVI
jgi:hypothetical protein